MDDQSNWFGVLGHFRGAAPPVASEPENPHNLLRYAAKEQRARSTSRAESSDGDENEDPLASFFAAAAVDALAEQGQAPGHGHSSSSDSPGFPSVTRGAEQSPRAASMRWEAPGLGQNDRLQQENWQRMQQHLHYCPTTAAEEPREELERAFRRAFAVVDESPARQWAKEFLLDQSPQAAAQMLTNPAALPHAVSSEYVGTLLETDGKHSGRFDAHTRLDDMFVPAFSVGDLTVGVSVHRSAAPKGMGPKDPQPLDTPHSPVAQGERNPEDARAYSLGRYVRDARNNRMLVISHDRLSAHSPPAKTRVLYMSTVSSTKSERIDISCDGPLFAKGFHLESAMFCASALESRFCPLCNAPPNAQCRCTLPAAKPAHSLDFSSDILAMSRFPGEFLGTTSAVAATCPPGAFWTKTYERASLVSNLRLSGYSCASARHRELETLFQSFAVQLSLSEQHPSRAIMPAAGDGDMNSASIVPASVNDRMPLFPVDDEGLLGLPNTSDDMVVPCDLSDAHTRHIHPLDALIDVLGENSDAVVPVDLDERAAVSDGSMTLDVARTSSSSGSSGQDYRTDHERRDSRLAHTAPPAVSPSPLILPVVTDDAAIQEVIMRDLKRRQQNRAAAARSNARRKERNNQLKLGLAEVHRRASELRDKETVLRSENILLRKRLGSAQREQRSGSSLADDN